MENSNRIDSPRSQKSDDEIENESTSIKSNINEYLSPEDEITYELDKVGKIVKYILIVLTSLTIITYVMATWIGIKDNYVLTYNFNFKLHNSKNDYFPFLTHLVCIIIIISLKISKILFINVFKAATFLCLYL